MTALCLEPGTHGRLVTDRIWPLCKALHNGQKESFTTVRFKVGNLATWSSITCQEETDIGFQWAAGYILKTVIQRPSMVSSHAPKQSVNFVFWKN